MWSDWYLSKKADKFGGLKWIFLIFKLKKNKTTLSENELGVK